MQHKLDDAGGLALEFKAYKQHAQVIGNFNKDFVHTEVVALVEQYLKTLD